MTRTAQVGLRQAGHEAGGCLRLFASDLTKAGPHTFAVRRTGVLGESLSVYATTQRVAVACDRTTRAGGKGEPWCGSAHGDLTGISLRDPRLDVGCVTAGGARVGFAWIDPLAAARWIVVRGGSDAEVYDVVRGLPVRVTTTRVDASESRASFDVTQVDAKGDELRHETIRAYVAG